MSDLIHWLAEARRYAKHIYCYEELIDDHFDWFTRMALDGKDVYDAVAMVGETYDLTRCDGFYGVNSDTKFEKKLRDDT